MERSLRTTSLVLTVASLLIIAAPPVSADAGQKDNPYGHDWPGRNDVMGIAQISHRHATDGDVIYRIAFRHGFPTTLLVGRFVLFFQVARGTTPAFPSTPGWQERWLIGAAVEHEGRVMLQLSYFDEDTKHGQHALGRVPLRKVGKTLTTRFAPSRLATPPFRYRWQAQTSLGQVSQDLTAWLTHSIGRDVASRCGHRSPSH